MTVLVSSSNGDPLSAGRYSYRVRIDCLLWLWNSTKYFSPEITFTLSAMEGVLVPMWACDQHHRYGWPGSSSQQQVSEMVCALEGNASTTLQSNDKHRTHSWTTPGNSRWYLPDALGCSMWREKRKAKGKATFARSCFTKHRLTLCTQSGKLEVVEINFRKNVGLRPFRGTAYWDSTNLLGLGPVDIQYHSKFYWEAFHDQC